MNDQAEVLLTIVKNPDGTCSLMRPDGKSISIYGRVVVRVFSAQVRYVIDGCEFGVVRVSEESPDEQVSSTRLLSNTNVSHNRRLPT